MSSNVKRRGVIRAGAGVTLASLVGGVVPRARAEGLSGATGKFDDSTVIQIARRLANAEYHPPGQTLPKALDNLTFDQYRGIAYRPDRALWLVTALRLTWNFSPVVFSIVPG